MLCKDCSYWDTKECEDSVSHRDKNNRACGAFKLNRYYGNDNYGKPKQNYLDKIKSMDDEDLYHETYQMIYHSARCNNNPRADWHWMIDACYDEWQTRNDKTGYGRAYNQCYKDYCGG